MGLYKRFGSRMVLRIDRGEEVLTQLHRAAEQGELYLAVSESGELAGAMRIVMKGFCGLYPYLSLIGVRDGFRGAVWEDS